MTESIQAYPLHWPPGVPRTPEGQRQRARFSAARQTAHGYRSQQSLSLSEASDRLRTELDRLGAVNEVVSTNLTLRLDGWPRAGQRTPEDPGVAVYWLQATLNGYHEQRCIPCDRWDRIPDNIAAVAAAIGALRGLDRWVNDHAVNAAFSGFAALPHAPDPVDHWREVLELTGLNVVTVDDVNSAFNRLSRIHHPDRGGTDEAMQRLLKARADGRAACT